MPRSQTDRKKLRVTENEMLAVLLEFSDEERRDFFTLVRDLFCVKCGTRGGTAKCRCWTN